MLFFIFGANAERSEADLQLDELKGRIEEFNAYKPYPSEKNIDLIKNHTNTLNINIFTLEDV